MRRVVNVLGLVLLLALPAKTIFWACPEVTPDDTVPDNTAEALKIFMAKFPAHLYIKSGSSDDRKYSCLTMSLLEDYDLTPCGCEPFNMTIDYYDGDEKNTAYGNYSIDFTEQPYQILFTGLPGDMFGADGNRKQLGVLSMGEKYVILRSCQAFFLNVGYSSYSYLFTPVSLDMSKVTWQCMAEEFKDVTEASYADPGGICNSNFTF